MPQPDRTAELHDLLRRRILILDGAMGTMIQRYKLDEAAYRGERFASHPRDLKGANDLLCLTRPSVIEEIHRQYLEAGADIIETNTFNAQAISMSDYGLESVCYEINLEAAKIARRAADAVSTKERPRFVAGAMGPTNRTASLSPDVNNPAFRGVSFDELVDAYYEEVRGLVDGGVDILIPETTFDTLNLKAAIFAIEKYFADHNLRLPVMLSVTITDASGRTLSGQTVEAFWNSVSHAPALSVGINCALGAAEMRPHVEELSAIAPLYISCYPNAGLPNALGAYDETPRSMAKLLREFAENGWLNVVGGCCGTTPDHIRAIAEAMRDLEPRVPAMPEKWLRLSGLEPLTVRPDSNFIMVGERTNITGSPKFAQLVKAGDLEGALAIAKQQIDGGANILDVNMDEGLLDSEQVMHDFLNLVASEPDIAKVPLMIDSSKWSVIEAGLKCTQGKSVVNSISLKEGEAKFRAEARLIRRYGAAVVIMAFDEKGQADTIERKVEVSSRAADILLDAGFDESDIIFDPAVLTVATGMEEHNDYGVGFIEAVRRLRQKYPRANASGGISNVSFSFRGNKTVREAMHAAFLYHAIHAGLTMGIVNAGQLAIYEEIPKDLLELVEDVLLNRRPDATERLTAFAESIKDQGVARTQKEEEAWRSGNVQERLSHALVKGIIDHLEPDLEEARTGREERARDEKSGGLAAAVHGSGEGEGGRRLRARQDPAGDGEGRRARHREEHRRRGARLQQLRGHRPRRDGLGRQDPRHRQGPERRHRRPLRPDHAVARRDGPRGPGDGAARVSRATAHRRRDDVEAAHRGAHRPALHGADRARARRLARRRRRLLAPRREARRAHRVGARGVREAP